MDSVLAAPQPGFSVTLGRLLSLSERLFSLSIIGVDTTCPGKKQGKGLGGSCGM